MTGAVGWALLDGATPDAPGVLAGEVPFPPAMGPVKVRVHGQSVTVNVVA